MLAEKRANLSLGLGKSWPAEPRGPSVRRTFKGFGLWALDSLSEKIVSVGQGSSPESKWDTFSLGLGKKISQADQEATWKEIAFEVSDQSEPGSPMMKVPTGVGNLGDKLALASQEGTPP